MTTVPPPIMPQPRRASSPSRVRRYLVASREHAARLFADGSTLRTAALDALTREAGAAVVVESLGGTTVATMPLANGHEVAAALAGVPGAVTFAWRNQPAGEACEAMGECGPPSRDPSLAAVEVEVVRLRKVEAAARALLASLPQCGWCSKRVATCAKRGVESCDRCAAIGDGMAWDSPIATQVRALEALLTSST